MTYKIRYAGDGVWYIMMKIMDLNSRFVWAIIDDFDSREAADEKMRQLNDD